MQTERLKRLRAWAGGWGVSTRMAARARSFQTRATLLVPFASLRKMRFPKNKKKSGSFFTNTADFYIRIATRCREFLRRGDDKSIAGIGFMALMSAVAVRLTI